MSVTGKLDYDDLLEQTLLAGEAVPKLKARIAELEAAAKCAFAAIGVARCIQAISDEYDFEPAYVALRDALLPDEKLTRN